MDDVDTVLGVSITRGAAGLVLLEGREPDGVTVNRDAVDLNGAHAAMTDVMAAVLGIQGSVSAKGHKLRAVGVTWSSGSESKARELVTTLTEFGLDNIAAVRPSEAKRTLTDSSQHAEVTLARGAALALARNETQDTSKDEKPRGKRFRLDPSSIAAATVLAGGTIGVLAALWIGVAPRHADSEVAPPAPQPRSAPPVLQVPPPASAAAAPAPASPQPAPTESSTVQARQVAPTMLQPRQHGPANGSAAGPGAVPADGQEPAADAPIPAPDQPPPPSPEPGIDVQNPPGGPLPGPPPQ